MIMIISVHRLGAQQQAGAVPPPVPGIPVALVVTTVPLTRTEPINVVTEAQILQIEGVPNTAPARN